MRSALLGTMALAFAAMTACPAVNPIAAEEADTYCEHGMHFEYLDNGSVSDLDDPKTIEVGSYSEFVVYLESENAECDGGNYDETVELRFKLNESSPWGSTGQVFSFGYAGGGRFRADGKYLKMAPQCDVPFSFEYTLAGVRCADAP
jgi:hypothetical protein